MVLNHFATKIDDPPSVDVLANDMNFIDFPCANGLDGTGVCLDQGLNITKPTNPSWKSDAKQQTTCIFWASQRFVL